MDNRRALLRGALRCIEQRGYAATTARAVADTAGVSLGAIGYHFGSTQRLLDEALAEAVRRWTEPLIARVPAPELTLDPAALAAGLDDLLDTFGDNRPVVVAYFEALLHAERDPELREQMAREYHHLRSALAQAIHRRLVAADPALSASAEAAATVMMAIFDGLLIQWLLDPDRLPSGQQLIEVLALAGGLDEKRTGTSGAGRAG